MQDLVSIKNDLEQTGFSIVGSIFNQTDIEAITEEIESCDSRNSTFRKSKDLFAVRQFLKEIPSLTPLIFSSKFKELFTNLFGKNYFVVKSIYFDKPPSSNWFVAYHQDLTISVKEKKDIDGYGPWTVKQNQFAVQPPIGLLKDNFTVRIHLDKTTIENGALKVIPGSHLKGINRPETINRAKEVICNVDAGGIMFMKPLLLHASQRTTNNSRRRVIHIEFSRNELPKSLTWAEYMQIF